MYIYVCINIYLPLSSSLLILAQTHTHTQTHTHIYIYIYIHMTYIFLSPLLSCISIDTNFSRLMLPPGSLNYSSADVKWHPCYSDRIATAATNGAILVWTLGKGNATSW